MLTKLKPRKRKKKSGEIIFLLIYIIGFFYAQYLYAGLYNRSSFTNDYYKLTLIRFSIWVVPVLLILAIIGKNPLDYLKLRGNVLKGVLWGLIIGGLIILYNIASVRLINGHVSFSFNIDKRTWFEDLMYMLKPSIDLYNISLIFSEEVVFRGFILQRLDGITRFWFANIITGALFVLMHFMGYIVLGKFTTSLMINVVLGLMVFSLIQGYTLKKTNSLWACVIIHFINNFISTAIIK